MTFHRRGVALLWLAILSGSLPALAQENSTTSSIMLKVPPPSVADVLTQVRTASAVTSEVEEKKKLVKQEPPASAKDDELVAFLTQRALAADDLGNIPRRLADLKQIAELSRGTRTEVMAFYNLGLAETIYGDVRSGEAALKHVGALLEKTNSNVGLEINSLSILAVVYTHMGMTSEAAEAVGKAKWLLDRVKARPGGWAMFVPSWEMLANFGEGRLLVTRGKWREAEAVLRQAAAKGEETAGNLDGLTKISPNPSMQTALLAGRNMIVSELAQHLLRLGNVDEAELVVRDMLTTNLQRVGRYSVRTLMMLTQLAEVLNVRGRYRDALQVLNETDEIRRALGIGVANALTLATTRARINALVGMEDWAASVGAMDASGQRLLAAGLPDSMGFSSGRAIALIRTGRGKEALSRLAAHQAKLTGEMGVEHVEVAEARGVTGMALVATGNKKAALVEFAAALPVLIGSAVQNDDAQSRSLRTLVRRQILEAYLDALAASSDIPDAAAQAFRIADALHIGKTQQAMAQSAARSAAKQADLGELIRLEQDSKAESLSLYGALLRLSALPADKQLPKIMADMRLRISTIEKERQERELVIEKRFPAYANLIHPKPPTLAEARAVLKPTEALISIFSTEQASYVWALKATGEVGFARAPLTNSALGKIVASLRKAVDPGDADIANGLPAFDLDGAYRLYASLLLPVANAWKGADSLLVVANGALSQLPPALLPTAKMTLGKDSGARYSAYRAVPWLIREAAVTQLPSVNSLVALRQLPQSTQRQREFVGVGDPEFSVLASAVTAKRGLRNLAVARFSEPQAGAATPPATGAGTATAPIATGSDKPVAWAPYESIPALPDTRDEILALAKVLNADISRDVFLGKDASKEKVKQLDLSQTRIIAFATHGLLSGEFPGVDQPSLALANPGNGQHGLLTLEEILGLKLNADWVVLSACNTAGGDGAGAEAISGLGRGFFYAGTRSLLATHWPVESVSARILVTEAFARQAATPTLARAQALRQSMLALMDQHATDGGFAYAHPLFWAPYALFGDGGK
jgi:CHAT domain-containing protein